MKWLLVFFLAPGSLWAQSLPSSEFGAASVEVIEGVGVIKSPYWLSADGRKIPLSGDSTFDFVCKKFGFQKFMGGRGELAYMTVSLYGDYTTEIIKEIYCKP
tara:strand:- start:997 stop:1302 length:306 start_codon:yes stop_codon:yes gene_type:complete